MKEGDEEEEEEWGEEPQEEYGGEQEEEEEYEYEYDGYEEEVELWGCKEECNTEMEPQEEQQPQRGAGSGSRSSCSGNTGTHDLNYLGPSITGASSSNTPERRQRLRKEPAVGAAKSGGKETCWEYLDPGKNKHGPFSEETMSAWYRQGMLPAQFLVRHNGTVPYVPLLRLSPPPQEPFKTKPALKPNRPTLVQAPAAPVVGYLW